MTTGQLLFYGGFVLLGLTVLLAIIFLVKKPTYNPENTVYDTSGGGRTQSMRNGYPTEAQTIRRGRSSSRTEPMATEPLDEEDAPVLETDRLAGGSGPAAKTEHLPEDATQGIFQETE